MSKYKKYTQEYRDEAVKMVLENDQPIARVARDLGINEGTLGNWVNKYRREHPVSEELSLPALHTSGGGGGVSPPPMRSMRSR